MKSLNCVWLFATPWTVAHQAPRFLGFSSHKYWSGLPFPSPGNLPDPGIEPGSPTLQADALPSEPPGKPRKDHVKSQGSHKLTAGCRDGLQPGQGDIGESPVVQWLGILLPMQGTRVQSLVQEDSTCFRATALLYHSCWPPALKPTKCNYWSSCTREWPSWSPQPEKAPGSNRDPVQPKINKGEWHRGLGALKEYINAFSTNP